MTQATIIAARRAVAIQFRSILRDWAALGLIAPVAIVDVEHGGPSDSALAAYVVGDGPRRTELLTGTLSRGIVSVARLCVVSVVDDEHNVVSMSEANRARTQVLSALPQARLISANLLAGSGDDDWAGRGAAMMGWHNYALSPEDAASPSQGLAPLRRSSDDPRWLIYLVGSLCSLLGLWKGQESSVLDTREAPSGELVVPLRVFSRALSANDVEHAVHSKLLDVGQRYPLPRVDLSRAVVAGDESLAAVGMADALLDKHEEVLPRSRVSPPPPPAKPLDFLTALRQFFRFLVDALRNAPSRIADDLWRRARAKVAHTVQSVVFGGADSSFAVVVRGVRADGSCASWTEFESGLESVIHRSAPGAELTAPAQYPQLWHDFVDGGMTLLDAGRRSQDLAPRTMGVHVAVVATTARVAPSHREAFRLPNHLAPHLPGWEVEAGDDISAGRLYTSLDLLGRTQPHLAADLAAEKHRLRTWSGNTANSYVGRLGRRLGDAFRSTVTEVQELNQRIAALQAQEALPDEIGKSQEALARRIKILAITGIVGLLALIALIVLGAVGLVLGLGVIVALIVIWALTSVMVYMKAQQRLYQLLHKREQAATQLQVALRHRQEALEDLRRLARVYRQFLDWSRAFSAFVHAPLGRVPERSAAAVLIGQGMPRSIRLGAAVPNDEAIDEVCNDWRHQLFPAGWLSDCWKEFISEVPASLGQRRFDVQADTEVLFTDQNPDGLGSILTRWSTAIEETSVNRKASTTFLRKVRALSLDDESARTRLLSTVNVRDSESGDLRTVTTSEFLEGLDRSYQGSAMSFLSAMFSPSATDVNIRSIRDNQLNQEFDGLALATVLMQTGGAFPLYEFRTRSSYHPPEPLDDNPNPSDIYL